MNLRDTTVTGELHKTMGPPFRDDDGTPALAGQNLTD